MEKQLSFHFTDDFSETCRIHDALYNYNLEKTKAERVDAHACEYPEQFALVARDENGKSYGGISFHWLNDPRRIFVSYVFFDDEIRGCGAGRKIFQELIDHARKNGAVQIDLTTNTFQAPGFYQKMGFRITHEEKRPAPACPENIHSELTLEL